MSRAKHIFTVNIMKQYKMAGNSMNQVIIKRNMSQYGGPTRLKLQRKLFPKYMMINRSVSDVIASNPTRINYKEFANQKMIVTGATSGIGNGTAKRLAEQNTTIIAIVRNSKSAAKLKDSKIDNLVIIEADLSKPEEMNEAMKQIIAEKPTFLINAAGISIATNGRDKFLNLDYKGLRQVHCTNFDAVFYLSQQICKYWVDSHIAGRVVNVSSAASKATLTEHIAYTTSKYALDALTKTMALELGEYGIRVNSVHPTVTLTEMAYKVWFEEDRKTPTPAAKELLKQIPFGRFIEVDEVVDTIFWLLSDSAMPITGQLISIDGGLTC